MNKKSLSESDICDRFISPALVSSGWGETRWRREYPFTAGRIIVRGELVARGKQKRADYLLFYKSNIPIAVIEAKDNTHSIADGHTHQPWLVSLRTRAVALRQHSSCSSWCRGCGGEKVSVWRLIGTTQILNGLGHALIFGTRTFAITVPSQGCTFCAIPRSQATDKKMNASSYVNPQ